MMKIYRILIDERFRPDHQDYVWPPQNQRPGGDYGVEQDFDRWLLAHPSVLVDDPAKANWLYIPIFWNRYYINTHDENDHWGGGIEALSDEVDRCMEFEMPSFTVAEADIKWLQPSMRWRNMVVFCASRRDSHGGIDIPLLSAPHSFLCGAFQKKWLASFIGSLGTDEIRREMKTILSTRKDCFIEHGNNGIDFFVNLMLSSYIALCPRGQGGQSFRMYEAMQLGTAPLYLSDLDCRPFKRWIDWDKCSFWKSNPEDLLELFSFADIGDVYFYDDLIRMGKAAKQTYDEQLAYGKWCPFVIQELGLL